MHAAFCTPLFRTFFNGNAKRDLSIYRKRFRTPLCSSDVSKSCSHSQGEVSRRTFIHTGVGVTAAALAGGSNANAFDQLVIEKSPSASFARSDRPIPEEFRELVESASEFTLQNGMKFIVLGRHHAPVVSFIVHANVGGVDEPSGKTGMAHFLEHLAFKGTSSIGTRNYAVEKPLLEKLDNLSEQIKAAKADLLSGDEKQALQAEEKYEKLRAEFNRIDTQAEELVIPNEFGRLVEQNGGVGLNATTSLDATRYFYSFPVNKLELWFALESERFRDPVFRQFHREKEVIKEERRLTVDNSPVGKLVEDYLASSFKVHPYRRPVIGYPVDLEELTRKDVQTFFKQHYGPSNLTVSIVGDVTLQQVQDYAQRYFGRMVDNNKSESNGARMYTEEPVQSEPVSIQVSVPAQEPLLLIGFHRPPASHPDDAAYAVISSILSDGRTSRLYRSLVEEQRVASTVETINGFPGDRFANLVMLYAAPSPGRTVDELEAALSEQMAKFLREGVNADELEQVKRQSRKALIEALRSNERMASLLAEYQVYEGDWRNLFRTVANIDAVTADDCMRVAKETFVESNRCSARTVPQTQQISSNFLMDDSEDELLSPIQT